MKLSVLAGVHSRECREVSIDDSVPVSEERLFKGGDTPGFRTQNVIIIDVSFL